MLFMIMFHFNQINFTLKGFKSNKIDVTMIHYYLFWSKSVFLYKIFLFSAMFPISIWCYFFFFISNKLLHFYVYLYLITFSELHLLFNYIRLSFFSMCNIFFSPIDFISFIHLHHHIYPYLMVFFFSFCSTLFKVLVLRLFC
jgi:hypothetical protein